MYPCNLEDFNLHLKINHGVHIVEKYNKPSDEFVVREKSL